MRAQGFELRLERHAAVGPIIGAAGPETRRARIERRAQLDEFLFALRVDLRRFLERRRLLGAGREQLTDFAIARCEQLARFGQPQFNLRQPVEDRLLKDAPCILMLVRAHLMVCDRFRQLLDLGIPPIDFDALPGGRKTRLLDLRFEPMHFHREVSPHPILVGADFLLGER